MNRQQRGEIAFALRMSRACLRIGMRLPHGTERKLEHSRAQSWLRMAKRLMDYNFVQRGIYS